MTEIEWVESVVGKPWVDRSTGPDSFDCWGLVVDSFARIEGVTLPEVAGYADGQPIEDIGNAGAESWREVQGPVAGCVFCVYLNTGAMVHVGRVIMIRKVGLFAIHAAGKDGNGQVAAEPMRQILSRYDGRLKFFVRPE